MTIYNVHIYRKIRLTFEGIEAQTLEGAVRNARDGLTSDADDIDEGGEDLSARVEIDGDDAPEHAFTIDFEPERHAARTLLAALEGALYALDENMEGSGPSRQTAIANAYAAVAEAKASGIRQAVAAAVQPIVTVTVRGGLIEDMDGTSPVNVVIEDWDVPDEDTGKKPSRSVWELAGGMPDPRAEKLRRLIVND